MNFNGKLHEFQRDLHKSYLLMTCGVYFPRDLLNEMIFKETILLFSPSRRHRKMVSHNFFCPKNTENHTHMFTYSPFRASHLTHDISHYNSCCVLGENRCLMHTQLVCVGIHTILLCNSLRVAAMLQIGGWLNNEEGGELCCVYIHKGVVP